MGGDFSIFDEHGAMPERMLWVAGGVGVTPFLAFHEAIQRRQRARPDVVLLFACHGDEAQCAAGLDGVRVVLFDSAAERDSVTTAGHRIFSRRMLSADVDDVDGLQDRSAFVCGPELFRRAVVGWLTPHVPENKIHFEKFF
jgi:ferredoxin-NADP reductase